MGIQSVSFIGLGALGVLFGSQMNLSLSKGALTFVADEARVKKYKERGVYANQQFCDFDYRTPESIEKPVDLLIFSVKADGLDAAIELAKPIVSEHTIILSLLNGISSERILGSVFGEDKVLYSVAQGMDAVKVNNILSYHHMGMICFGDQEAGETSKMTKEVAEFFDRTGIPYEVDTNMIKRQWGKFMLNVGVNQTVAVYRGNYGTIQVEGEPRETMIAAMREVIRIAQYEGVTLTEDDLSYWLNVLDQLNAEGKPSMAQDVEAGRKSEVELFAGTVIALYKKHKLAQPTTNQMLYENIQHIDSHSV